MNIDNISRETRTGRTDAVAAIAGIAVVEVSTTGAGAEHADDGQAGDANSTEYISALLVPSFITERLTFRPVACLQPTPEQTDTSPGSSADRQVRRGTCMAPSVPCSQGSARVVGCSAARDTQAVVVSLAATALSVPSEQRGSAPQASGRQLAKESFTRFADFLGQGANELDEVGREYEQADVDAARAALLSMAAFDCADVERVAPGAGADAGSPDPFFDIFTSAGHLLGSSLEPALDPPGEGLVLAGGPASPTVQLEVARRGQGGRYDHRTECNAVLAAGQIATDQWWLALLCRVGHEAQRQGHPRGIGDDICLLRAGEDGLDALSGELRRQGLGRCRPVMGPVAALATAHPWLARGGRTRYLRQLADRLAGAGVFGLASDLSASRRPAVMCQVLRGL